MKTNSKILIFMLCLIGWAAQAQQNISGIITDQETKQALPFSSIAVPNSSTGTMTNANGKFELQLKEDQNQIQISYVGYIDTLITIDPEISFYEIEVQPYTFSLTEIIVTSLTPLEYIQKALEKHPSMIPDQPFESQAFFASKRSLKNDDNNSYDLDQSVFKTYFSDYSNDTLDEASQLILYNNIREGEFESILEKNKRMQSAIGTEEKKDTFELKSENEKVSIKINDITGAGPYGALKEAKSITQLDFFDAEYFKKFQYNFGEQTFYQGRELIKINFSNKRKVGSAFYNGSVYLDYKDLAIVAIDYNVRAKIPFHINLLLKAFVGFTIDELKRDVKIRNQYLGKWYPKELVFDLDITIKQKKELETISIAQVLNMESIEIDSPKVIEEEKIFSEDLEYEEQIFSIPGIEWEDVNVIKIDD